MKNTIAFLLLLAALAFPSCNEDEVSLQVPTCENCVFSCLAVDEVDVISNACIDNWDCQFRFIHQAAVDTDEVQGVTTGNKTVFQMINATEGDLAIADDEFTNILVFELEESQTSFSVEDELLGEMNVYFIQYCFCFEVLFKEVTIGCLQGEKQSDGRWRIQGDLTTQLVGQDYGIKFDAMFTNN